jgi:Uma2 family endonuclease
MIGWEIHTRRGKQFGGHGRSLGCHLGVRCPEWRPCRVAREVRAVSVPVATGLTYQDLASFREDTVVQPDVVYLSPDRALELTEERFVDVVPDLLVEVSSPSTYRLDLIKKRNLYEREGVAEYWFVDLEADQIDVHRLDDSGHYGQPESLGEGDTLTCLTAPGFSLPVGEALVT